MEYGAIQAYLVHLAKNGWANAATNIINSLASSQNLPLPEASNLLAAVSANAAGTTHDGHQLHGVVVDSVVSSLQFTNLEYYEEMKSGFKQAVRWIEIETSSQCNRQCSYCPNSEFDRRTSNKFMEWPLFEKLIGELKEISYDGAIKFVGNNEFFMHEKNFDYLRHAREALPNARFELFSNGDYLTRDLLDRAAQYGIARLNVTLHNAPKKSFNEAETLSRAFRLSEKLGIRFVLQNYVANTWVEFGLKYRGMDLIAHDMNFEAVGHDWGAFFDERKRAPRTAPCTYPLRQFIVNHMGAVFMCCRAFKEATPYTLETGSLTANLSDYPTIFHVYASDKHVKLRQMMFSNDAKKGPCEHCDGDESVAIIGAQQILNATRTGMSLGKPECTPVQETHSPAAV